MKSILKIIKNVKSKKYLDQYSLGSSNGFLYPSSDSPIPPPFLRPKLTENAIEYPSESEKNFSSSLKSSEKFSLNMKPYNNKPMSPNKLNKIKFFEFSVIDLIIFYRSSDRLTISSNNMA
jgi:hypothetical protein